MEAQTASPDYVKARIFDEMRIIENAHKDIQAAQNKIKILNIDLNKLKRPLTKGPPIPKTPPREPPFSKPPASPIGELHNLTDKPGDDDDEEDEIDD